MCESNSKFQGKAKCSNTGDINENGVDIENVRILKYILNFVHVNMTDQVHVDEE